MNGVSVIAPILNEELHLRAAVHAVLASDWDGDLEVILALGPSTDRTNEVAQKLSDEDSRVKCVDNPSGSRATGLNLALAKAQYDTVVRMDGHCEFPPNYISTAMATMAQTEASNVGGIMDAEGETQFEQAVAVAMKSPLGVGNSSFHTGGKAGPALTVYLGVFNREAVEKVGGFNPAFDRAEDWELNLRIRESGGLIWFTPDLSVTYRPRPSVSALAKQYFHYGRWRRALIRRYPNTASVRYLAPPVATAAIAVGTVVGLAGFAGPAALKVGFVIPAGYAAVVAGGSAVVSRGNPMGVRLRVPAAIATMHLAWGWGFLTSREVIKD